MCHDVRFSGSGMQCRDAKPLGPDCSLRDYRCHIQTDPLSGMKTNKKRVQIRSRSKTMDTFRTSTSVITPLLMLCLYINLISCLRSLNRPPPNKQSVSSPSPTSCRIPIRTDQQTRPLIRILSRPYTRSFNFPNRNLLLWWNGLAFGYWDDLS